MNTEVQPSLAGMNAFGLAELSELRKYDFSIANLLTWSLGLATMQKTYAYTLAIRRNKVAGTADTKNSFP
jgi:hypothetical protein